MKDDFVAALIKEIQLTSSSNSGTAKDLCETVYFGGGTPSILDVDDLMRVFDALHASFLIPAGAEITLEANPDDITPGKLRAWKQLGINRLSVGVQSFLDKELVWMNRAHTSADSLRCIMDIKDAGFTDYSIDLIYGSPLLSNEDWKRTVARVIEMDIPHISCYALTVEPKTPLDKFIAQKKSAPVDVEVQAEQFILLMDWMELHGYEHYEISNFAKAGMRSKHNSAYWQGKKYYGFGPSAHSYDGQSRKWNIANNALYIQALKKNSIPSQEELLTTTQQLNEYIMVSLRTTEGLDLEKVRDVFGGKYAEQLKSGASKYLNTNKLQHMLSTLQLTKEGKLFADGIAADLFF